MFDVQDVSRFYRCSISDVHIGRSLADISDREGSTIGENIRVQTSLDVEELADLPDEITPTLQSAIIIY